MPIFPGESRTVSPVTERAEPADLAADRVGARGSTDCEDSAIDDPITPSPADMTYSVLQRLGDIFVNQRLLAALDACGDQTRHVFPRANLLRRMGDLTGARAMIRTWLAHAPGSGPPDEWSAIPAGLHSHGGYALAPLVMIDDFLPRERMLALHSHACAREGEFRDALATNAHEEPRYDPQRRRTLVDNGFTLERPYLQSFVVDNLRRLCQCLGLEPFEIDRIELKLTNHVDGGFFKTHRDNHDPVRQSGRAITWLYYFAGEETGFSGGDLYLFDSKPTNRAISPAWFTRVEAVANRFIAFPSWFYHAVGPTHLPGGTFAQGRFAASSHVRKTQDSAIAWWERDSTDAA